MSDEPSSTPAAPAPEPAPAPAAPANGGSPFSDLNSPSALSDFLNFRLLITPKFIVILYYVVTALLVLASLAMMFQGRAMILAGLLSLVLSPIVARIYCEFVYVIFGIHELLKESNKTLSDIRQKIK